jgi:hypothetical protein
MLWYKYFISILLLSLLAKIGQAQQSAIQYISENDLKRHVSFLAADNLQGRDLGSAGLEATAEYLCKEAKKAGLNPGVNNFYQNFSLVSTRPNLKNSFIKKSDSERILIDSVICMNQFTKHIKQRGEVVFAGFGFQDENYDDLKNVDTEGKIVICATGSPEIFKSEQQVRWSYRLEYSKANRLFEKGASSVIFITNPKDSINTDYYRIFSQMNRQRFSAKADSASIQGKIFVTVPEFADNILGEKNDYKNYLQKIANQSLPHSFYPEKFEIEIQTSSFLKEHRVKNIIGLIEGSDSILKNECVVYMAHYDHLGADSEGNIYNGADDNASGCAALLEIAEVFSQPEFKPARSVLFLWVTGEERGFLGSGYYADNPVFPLAKTVACINLDMIGRVYEPRDSVWKNSPKLVKDFDGIYTLVSDFNPKLVQLTDSVSKELGLIPDNSLPEYFFRSSDHYHFHSRSVPILNLSTGYHAEYHKVTDEVSRIRFDKLKRVTELSFWIGYKMAGN